MLVETRTRAPRNQASSVRGAVSTRTPASFDLEFWTIRSFATLASLRFIFRAMVAPRVCTSTHAALAHRTTWRRFSTSATVWTRSLTRGARCSLGTRPQRRSTETLLDSVSFSCHSASDHFPPTRPTRSCQGVRGHGGCHRHGPRPCRRCRLEGTPQIREIRTLMRNRWPAAPRTPLPRRRRKKYPHRRNVSTFEPEADPTPRSFHSQNWHWQTKRNVEAFYAKGK